MSVPKSELRTLLREEAERLRMISYVELRRYLTPLHRRVLGPSGASYDLEVQAFRDDPKQKDGNLRIIVSGWLGGGQGRGLTEDFIVAPDGSFVGE